MVNALIESCCNNKYKGYVRCLGFRVGMSAPPWSVPNECIKISRFSSALRRLGVDTSR